MKIKPIVLSALLIAPLLLDSCHDNVINDMPEQPSEFISSDDGSSIKLLKGKDAGLESSKFPEIKQISSNSLKDIETVPETGVYIVDLDYIPYNLLKEIKNEGLTLHKNGTLTNDKGEKEAMFIYDKSYQVRANTSKEGRISSSHNYRANMTYSIRVRQDWSCRYVVAKSTAGSWEPELVNGKLVPLKIDEIKTVVTIGWDDNTPDDTSQCTNCNQVSASTEKKIGCAWPAVKPHSGKHRAWFRNETLKLQTEEKISHL
jgi:hypothetical protein